MDFEEFILDGLENIGQFDFNSVIRIFLFGLGVIWIFVTFAVWQDSKDRIKSLPMRLVICAFILPFNFVGLIGYLILRPKDTFESQYWSELEKRYLQYETREMGDCENCGYDLQPGFTFCPVCSYPVKLACPECNEMIERHWNFCPYCQTRQVAVKKSDIKKRVSLDEVVHVKGKEDMIKTTPAYSMSVQDNEASSDKEDASVKKLDVEKVSVSTLVDSKPLGSTKEPQPRFGLDDVSKKPELTEEAPKKQIVIEDLPTDKKADTKQKGQVTKSQSSDLENGPEGESTKPGTTQKRTKDVSFATKLGKYVLVKVSRFGKKINDVFLGLILQVKDVAEKNIDSEQGKQNESKSSSVKEDQSNRDKTSGKDQSRPSDPQKETAKPREAKDVRNEKTSRSKDGGSKESEKNRKNEENRQKKKKDPTNQTNQNGNKSKKKKKRKKKH